MKRVFSLIISISVLSLCLTSYATSIRVTDIENDIVTVSGELETSGNVLITVLNPGKSSANVTSGNYVATSEAVHTVIGGYKPAGDFGFDIKMLPDPVTGGGEYVFIVNTPDGREENQSLNFYSSEFKKSLIRYVNEHSYDDVKLKIDEIILKFGLSKHELFIKGNSADIAKQLVVARDNFTGDTIPADNAIMEKVLLESMLLSAFNCGNREAVVGENGYFKYMAEILDIEDDKKYIDYCNFINADGISAMNSILLNGEYGDVQDFLDAFEENVLVRIITDYKENGYGHVSNYFTKYESDYKDAGFDTSKLTSSISRSLVNANVSTLSELKDVFVLAQNENADLGGGSSSSGSSGSGSSGNSYSGAGFITNPAAVTPSSSVFSDISGYSWAKDAIEELYKRGIISGKGNGMYAPADILTRAELTKMIVNAFELKADGTSEFSDIDGHWAKEFITIANSLGIVNGTGDGLFAPDGLITREQAAKIIYGALTYGKEEIINSSDETKFADDTSISEYARQAVYFMKNSGIISGKGENMFAPNDNLTRAEAAKMIYGAINHHEEN